MFTFLSNLFGKKVPGRALRNEADTRVKKGAPLEAIALYNQALAEMDAADDNAIPVEREQCLENLAVAHVVIGDSRMGDQLQNYASAAECFARVLALREKRLGSDDDDVAELVRTLMTLNYVSGQYERALAYAERYLPVAERLPIDFAVDLIQTRTVLAQGNLALRRYPAAVEHYRELLETYIRIQGPVSSMLPDVTQHQKVLIVALSLAATLRKCGNHAEALSQYRQLLPVYEKAQPANERNLIGLGGGAAGQEAPFNWRLDQILGEMADCYIALGQFEDAVKLNLKRLESKKAVFGPEHYHVLTAVEETASVYKEAGRLDDLASLYEGLISELETKPAANSSQLTSLLIKLGMLRCSQSRLDEAEFAFRRAMFIDGTALAIAARATHEAAAPANPLRTSSVYCLSLVQLMRGENEEAISLARQALDVPVSDRTD